MIKVKEKTIAASILPKLVGSIYLISCIKFYFEVLTAELLDLDALSFT
jgi:hypothetical protein